MPFHTRLIGAFDALILTLTALTMAALLFALISPPPASERFASAATSGAAEFSYAPTLRA